MTVYPRQKLNFNLQDFFWLFFKLLNKNAIKDNDPCLLEQLKNHFGTNNLILTPSATYSFYKILKFLGINTGDSVILPAKVYPDFSKIISSMGAKCTFIEIDPATLNLDYKDIVKKDASGKIVVLPIHYGLVPKNIKKIVVLLKKKKCKIIFDSVQYFFPDKFLIQNGDALIYSFSRAKDLDLMGGGLIISKSKKLLDYINNESSRNLCPSRFYLLKNILRYFYMYFFTNKIIFPLVTFPLLLINSCFNKEIIASTPNKLFAPKKLALGSLNSSYRMCNLQFWFGVRKLPSTASLIKRRSMLGNDFYDFVSKNVKEISVPAVFRSIYYTFPIISRDKNLAKKLLRKGIDTKPSFLQDCSRQSLELFGKVIHIPMYSRGKKDLTRFKKNFIKCINNA